MAVRKFPASCSQCGRDRGLKPKDRLHLLCQKCNNSKIAESRLMPRDEAVSILAQRDDGVTLVSEWRGCNFPATFHDPEFGEWTVKYAGSVLRGTHHPNRGLKIIKEKVSGLKHSDDTKARLAELARGNTNSRGKKKSLEEVIKNSARQQGISVEEWKGFSTKETEIARGSFKKKLLHIECFKRSNFRCDCCNNQGSLNAHHLNSWKHHPELRFDINNLVCLCVNCHKQFHATYGNGHKQPNTVEQYLEFKEKQNEYRLCKV